ncbi:MFS transporter [Amycolatopsis sp. cg13]|uniref:MFS transporter n=1 Tax=Amycolatopsis sp. cg13 TaxID=3238807 RepID=UPI003526B0D5
MGQRATFRSVFRVREFRALWAAELFSNAGDQLARVALAILVYQRTESAALTGLTYALTFVPSLFGGVLLAGLGDRFPRRTVMVAADVARAVLVGLMALPGMPLWLLCVLVVATTLLHGPFKAAQQALLPDVLEGEKYTTGMAIRNITIQTAQLAGFAGGGVLVAGLSAQGGLVVDALTFVVSAAFVRMGVRRRPAAQGAERRPFGASLLDGARVIVRDPALMALLALCWLAGFYVVPEALAAPFANSLGASAASVGLLMAADPVGSIVGGIAFSQVPEPVQIRVIGVLGILAGVPLVAVFANPGLVVSMLLFALSGFFATAYNIQGTASFVRRLPDAHRAQGSGVLSAGLTTVQGLGALASGVLADAIGPAHAIAFAGLAGALVAIPIAVAWHRAQPARPALAG